MTKDFAPKDNGCPAFEHLFPPTLDQCRLLIECRQGDYCASQIARAVEDCNAQVLNLNVTALPPRTPGGLVVDLRANHRNSEPIARSLARYGYEVLEACGPDGMADEAMRSRANELLRMLEV